jgi:hypothetical protein
MKNDRRCVDFVDRTLSSRTNQQCLKSEESNSDSDQASALLTSIIFAPPAPPRLRRNSIFLRGFEVSSFPVKRK